MADQLRKFPDSQHHLLLAQLAQAAEAHRTDPAAAPSSIRRRRSRAVVMGTITAAEHRSVSGRWRLATAGAGLLIALVILLQVFVGPDLLLARMMSAAKLLAQAVGVVPVVEIREAEPTVLPGIPVPPTVVPAYNAPGEDARTGASPTSLPTAMPAFHTSIPQPLAATETTLPGTASPAPQATPTMPPPSPTLVPPSPATNQPAVKGDEAGQPAVATRPPAPALVTATPWPTPTAGPTPTASPVPPALPSAAPTVPASTTPTPVVVAPTSPAIPPASSTPHAPTATATRSVDTATATPMIVPPTPSPSATAPPSRPSPTGAPPKLTATPSNPSQQKSGVPGGGGGRHGD